MPPPGAIEYAVRMEPVRAAKIQSNTVLRYQKAAREFCGWCQSEGLEPWTVAEWDGALIEYRATLNPAKSAFENLVASVEFFFPYLRRKLSLTHAVLAGWNVAHQTFHHIPLCRGPAALLGVFMAAFGAPRLGAGLILQQRLGLRPSEMLGLLASDVVLPEEQGSGVTAAVLALGARKGTKLKRPQSVMVFEAENPDIIELLRRLRRVTHHDERLFPYSLEAYNLWLKHVSRRSGAAIDWTPHSARAGFASEARLGGKSFVEVRELGRWLSDSSLRIYLDLVETASIAVKLRTQGLGAHVDYALKYWLAYFPLYALLLHGSGRLDQATRWRLAHT